MAKQILIPKELADNLYKAIDNINAAVIGSPAKDQLKNELQLLATFQNWYLEKENKAIARDIYKLQKRSDFNE